MSARRGASGLSGILLVDKPAGMTSHDVVNRVRRATGERRVGHAGTLDPMATGLLVILVGPATRLAPYLTAAEKSYEAVIAFGSETDTDDADGTPTRMAPLPEMLFDPTFAEERVEALVGLHEQVPPAYSAIKQGGVVAHRAARSGEELELEARTVEVLRARLLAVDEAKAAWRISVAVSKGTYIRAIARDLGRSLDSAAHLAALRRTISGSLSADAAISLDTIESAEDPCEVATYFADPVAALDLPVVTLDAEGALRVSTGSVLERGVHCVGECPAEGLVGVAYDGVLLGVYVAHGDVLRARTVIPSGVKAGER